MTRTIRVVAAGAALIVATVGSVPGYAASPAGAEEADGFYVRIWDGDRRGIVLMEAKGDGARLTATLSGLEPGATYRVVGTDEDGDCSAPVTQGNRTFQTSLVATTLGRGSVVDAADYVVWRATRYVRVVKAGFADAWQCVPSLNFEEVRAASATSPSGTDEGPDAAYARFGARGAILVELLTATRARVTMALDGLADGHDFAIVGREGTCAAPGATAFSYRLEDVLISSFQSRRVDLTQEQLAAAGSIRVRDTSLKEAWGCRRGVLIALIVP